MIELNRVRLYFSDNYPVINKKSEDFFQHRVILKIVEDIVEISYPQSQYEECQNINIFLIFSDIFRMFRENNKNIVEFFISNNECIDTRCFDQQDILGKLTLVKVENYSFCISEKCICSPISFIGYFNFT